MGFPQRRGASGCTPIPCARRVRGVRRAASTRGRTRSSAFQARTGRRRRIAFNCASSVIGFLAFTALDPAVRAEAKKRGASPFSATKPTALIHPEAIDSNLAGLALVVVGEGRRSPRSGTQVRAQTRQDRRRGASRSIARPPRVGAKRPDSHAGWSFALPFDPGLRATEVTSPIWAQLQ